MTPDQRQEIKECIAFYEERGWDWSSVVTFLCLKFEGSLDHFLAPRHASWHERRKQKQELPSRSEIHTGSGDAAEVYMNELGKIAYDAYRESSGGKSLVSGQPIPEWHELSEPIKQAWRAAADAVVEAI